jgi:hypothetical protein
MQKLIHYAWAAALGFASIVEWQHFRKMEKRRDPRMLTTAAAAIACGYMASECLTGDWPSWD